MACCGDAACSSVASCAPDSPRWRRILWIALIVNGGFFLAEIVAGAAAGSAALQADALDFFGDAANYAISLGVASMALAWRARAAAAKGGTLIVFALWVVGNMAWHALDGTLPQAEVMGAVGVAALIANGGVALMLYRYRGGDANRRSVWICSRNDAIGNLAVILAAMGVFGTGTGWPDVIVAAIMSGLGLWGGWQIITHARTELRAPGASPQSSRAVPDEAVTHGPLVCSLSGDNYRNRITWIENLTRRALRGHRRNDLKLQLTYAPEAAANVRLMVEQERACCAFLTFALRQEPDAITVTIIVPEAVRGSADMLLAPFLAGQFSPNA